MSEKLYYDDRYMKTFTATVQSCREDKKGWAVILDRTAFYPEGGGQALALNSIGKYQWSTENVDIPEIENGDTSTVTAFSSCADTQAMLKAGDANTYPAAWAAHNYTTEGTNVGDWCLPAYTVARINSSELDFIDSVLDSVGGTVLGSMWTSTEYQDSSAFMFSRYSYGGTGKSSSLTVRPVIEF